MTQKQQLGWQCLTSSDKLHLVQERRHLQPVWNNRLVGPTVTIMQACLRQLHIAWDQELDALMTLGK